MNRDQDRYSPNYELENGLGLFGSDEELGTQIPTQAQSIVEGSGAISVSEYRPVPDVDYLQVCNHFAAKSCWLHRLSTNNCKSNQKLEFKFDQLVYIFLHDYPMISCVDTSLKSSSFSR